ncbi:MAG: hypothetical protein C5B47_00610 [Verrucomicrobia bacterium]|nr:MAG: hypothetical protein C5B47_00610 [Verrucomicrobiota bacterium]
MIFPKYILRSDFRILKFRRAIPHMDVAEYGRMWDAGTITWRAAFEIMSKHDLFYWGRVSLEVEK